MITWQEWLYIKRMQYGRGDPKFKAVPNITYKQYLTKFKKLS